MGQEEKGTAEEPQVRPLNPEGSLFLFGTEKVRLTYLRNLLAGEGVWRWEEGVVTLSTS